MISVIIPVFNEEKVITDCLKSLLVQSISGFEIIIIDDGSVDKSISRIKNIKDERIKLLFQDHNGPGAARNLGAKKAIGDILVFVDSDMVFAPDFLEKLIAPIKNNKSRGTFTKCEKVLNWGNSWARLWNYNQGIRSNSRIPENHSDKALVFRAILKTEFDKVKGFDLTGYTDDWSLSKKLGYKSTATEACCYHKNPSTLKEAYNQAFWIGKSDYLNYGVKKFINLLRFFLPTSVIKGFYLAIVYRELNFLIFKPVYDFGIFSGIVSSFFENNLYK